MVPALLAAGRGSAASSLRALSTSAQLRDGDWFKGIDQAPKGEAQGSLGLGRRQPLP